eukprot:g3372.t1
MFKHTPSLGLGNRAGWNESCLHNGHAQHGLASGLIAPKEEAAVLCGLTERSTATCTPGTLVIGVVVGSKMAGGRPEQLDAQG